MFYRKRIEDLEAKVHEIKQRYDALYLDHIRVQAEIDSSIRRTFNDELAKYRAAVQGTQTDRIKFGVLEEWISDVFKLNGLKFSDQDFIEKSEEQMLREKIAQEIEAAVIKVAGNSAETMRQAADIVRGIDK